jgi:hypothetical protein
MEKLVKWKPDDMVEVEFENYDDFLTIKETLTRIGISSKKEDTLFQSCHILHKRQKYYIVHFKELFALDGKATNISENDIGRRNTIVKLLEKWDLLNIVNPQLAEGFTVSPRSIKIISHAEKTKWKLEPKYNIGKNY